MKWLISTVGIIIVAVVVWGVYFSFDFKGIRSDAGELPKTQAASSEPKPFVESNLSDEEKQKVEERSKGDVNAPIALYEFSSFTCSHCKDFHLRAMPNLSKYIENGDLVVYFKDIFMDKRAASATLLSRCMQGDAYWKFLDILFDTQTQWGFSMDYENLLMNYATMQGLDREKAKACLNDKQLLKALIARRDNYANQYSIMGTPTIVIAYDGQTEHVNHGRDGKYIVEKIETILKDIKSKAESVAKEGKSEVDAVAKEASSDAEQVVKKVEAEVEDAAAEVKKTDEAISK